MTEGAYSLSDIAALMRDRDDGFLNGNGILIILFFLIFGMGGWGGFGNRAADGALTRAELTQGFNDNQMMNKLDGLANGICSSTYDIANKISEQTLNLNNGFNGVQASINQLGFQNQQCCCELKTAIHSEGEATRALIAANTVQALRDKIADKDRELIAAQTESKMAAQTDAILTRLGRFVTNPPCYQNYYTGCGCNSGVGTF